MDAAAPAPAPAAVAAAARQLADDYAAKADVGIRALHDAREMHAAADLLADVWQLPHERPPMEPGLLVALAHAGNYVAGAFRDEELVGVCVGFFHAPDERALHSHITGVLAEVVGSGIGRAIKFDQRSWCLEREVERMTWTFDPLIARNARFNLHTLGVQVLDYLPDFYGVMADGLNAGQPTDRLAVEWNLRDSQADDARAGRASNDDARVASRAVEVPADIEGVRRSDLEAARAWRFTLRETLVPLLADGWQITGFDRDSFYRLNRPEKRNP